MNDRPIRIAILLVGLVATGTLHAGPMQSALLRAQRFEAKKQFDRVTEVLEPYRDAADPDVDFMLANALLLGAIDGKAVSDVTPAHVQPAIDLAERCGANGNGRCLNLLYTIYSLGTGVAQDLPKAMEYMQRAVEAGDEGAKFNYAVRLYTGTAPVEKDVDQACRLFQDIVGGYAGFDALYYLGVAKSRGQCGQTADLQAGMRMIRTAANHGVPDAERDVGKDYENGWTTAIDIRKALQWYDKAAAHGDGEAAWLAGMIHVNGTYRKKDPSKAVHYFEQSAHAGYGNGKISLAVMYATGDGVERDFQKARTLYEEAAAMGDAHAYQELAIMYANGEGMPANLVMARVLFGQAIELGEPANEGFRRMLESAMTSEQLAAANAQIQQWRATRETTAP
ncbi:MAG TPA: tetratricopeptide repeat protein [Povalibacter sp.]|nr:tetratricopeptide repeat protein [Povalibacter sp.]